MREWIRKYEAENSILGPQVSTGEVLHGIETLSQSAGVSSRRVRLLLEGKRQDWVTFGFADRIITKGIGNPFLWYQEPLREWYLEKIDLRTNVELYGEKKAARLERQMLHERQKRLEARAA